MLKPVIRSLLIVILVVSPVFADEDLSVFEQQGGTNYPLPDTESNYLATLAPIASRPASYFGINIAAGLIALKPEITIGTGKNISDTQNKGAVDYAMGVYGGFGTNFNHFYIGTELSLAIDLLKKNMVDTISGYNTKLVIKRPITAGLDFIPGYLTQSEAVLFYGRLGVGVSSYKLEFVDVANNVNGKTNKMHFGWRAGLGAEIFINDLVSVRTEYVYSQYNDSKNNNISTPNVVYGYKLKSFGRHQVNLGLSMHF